ncbi:pentapeptide repeat-containing protein [Paenibacillus lautus]|uniref:pentapeptide repeat-containing protein n=1 Tax=Paenibacillus lautus TaxID=1401 RepID=UPI003D295385
MNRIEAWEQFTQEALKFRTEQIRDLHDFFGREKDRIAADLVLVMDEFFQYAIQLQNLDLMKKCCVIKISLLRTRLFEGHAEYMLEVFDHETLGSTKILPYRYEAKWIHDYFTAWSQACENKRKEYMGIIQPQSLDYWRREQVDSFHVYMVHAVRHAVDRLMTLPSYQELAKDTQFEICVGEYGDMEISESVYCCNSRQKSSTACKQWLDKKLDHEYVYEHIADVDISNGNYEGIQLNFTRLEKVKLLGSHLQGSYLLSSKFEACDCSEVDFYGSVMFDASFRECNLERACFDEITGGRDVMNENYGLMFGIHGVQFQGANLRAASFQHAAIAGDFRGALLEGIDFTGADLTGSTMLRRDQSLVSLSESQRQSIVWVEE